MVNMSEEEIWKTYPEYPFIEVSNLGRVRTKDRVVTRSNGRKYHIKGRVLKQQLSNSGYMQVDIHQMVSEFAYTFIAWSLLRLFLINTTIQK